MFNVDEINRIAAYIVEFYKTRCTTVNLSHEEVSALLRRITSEKKIANWAVYPSNGLIVLTGYNLEAYLMSNWMTPLLIEKDPGYTVSYMNDTAVEASMLIEQYLLDTPTLPDLANKPKKESKASNKPEILDCVARHVRCYMEREISTRASLKRYYNQHPAAPDIGSLTEEAVSSIEVAVDSIVNKAADILSCMSDVSFINGCLLGNIASGYACNRLLGHVPALKYTSTRDPIFYIDRVNEMCESYLRKMVTGPLTKDNIND
jgi:hypothetical protein